MLIIGYVFEIFFQLTFFYLLGQTTGSIAFNGPSGPSSRRLYENGILAEGGGPAQVGGAIFKEKGTSLYPSAMRQIYHQAGDTVSTMTREDKKGPTDMGECLLRASSDGDTSQKRKTKKKKKKSDKTSPTEHNPDYHDSQCSINGIKVEPSRKTKSYTGPYLEEGSQTRAQNDIRVVQKLFDSVMKIESGRVLAMKEDYRIRIEAAFEPSKPQKAGEIFHQVIKPQWSHIVHDPRRATIDYMEKSIQTVQMTGKKSKKTDRADSLIFNKLLEIFKTQLKLTDNQDHISIAPLDHDTYILLQLFWNSKAEQFFEIHESLFSGLKDMNMNLYELERRILTFTNQIAQKTLVENWDLISKSLIERDRRLNPAIMNALQAHFQLDREFPKILDSPQIFSIGNFLKTWMSDLEFGRRFRDPMEVGPRPMIKLSPEHLGILEEAERVNGADPWKVYHWINCLALGQVEKLEDLNELDIGSSVDIILSLVESKTCYKLIPWHESPDRACLIRMFTEETYNLHLNYICDRLKNKSHGERKDALETEVLRFQAYEKVKIYDNGLDLKLMQTIKMTRQYHSNYHSDWNLFFKNFPLKFKPHQQQFIKDWFQEFF